MEKIRKKNASYAGEITFGQKEKIEQIRKKYGHILSSHAFASLWIWKEKMGLTVEIEEDFFSVKSALYGKNAWFFPCGDDRKKKAFLEKQMEQAEEFSLYYMREEDRLFLEREYPGSFRMEETEESFEYLYARKDLECMEGGNFSHLRKELRKLGREHELQTVSLTDQDYPKLSGFFEGKRQSAHIRGYAGLEDDGIAEMVLSHYRELDLSGVLVFADGKPAAFAVGFPLTENTIDGCLERHDSSISGIAYYTERALLSFSDPRFCFMNGEEDLGIPGLRMMKKHLGPHGCTKIWSAKMKGRRIR